MRTKNFSIKPTGSEIEITFKVSASELPNLKSLEGVTPLEVQIGKVKKKRSLDANGYMWKLCDLIAQKLKTSKEEVYREHLRRVGVFDYLAVQEKSVGTFCEKWASKGTGWITDVLDSPLQGCKKIIAYYGSSTYDVFEMARLIDEVVTSAKELGIETMTPSEIERLKCNWRTCG